MDEVTIYIAVYGAIVATLSFVLSLVLGVHKLNQNKPKIRMSFDVARLTSPSGKQSEPLINVKIVNKGSAKVIVNSCGWLRKDKSNAFVLNPYRVDFPCTLEPGNSLSIRLPIRDFIEDLKTYRAFFNKQCNRRILGNGAVG
ncbi:MAG: hypothetical protein KIS80_02230 [Anaerolineales bacterium]|nr:hypothetical protein [Anaerolineales bacterium]